MPVKVVDASAIAAILFGEPEGEAVAARLTGARLVSPALLSFELANVCVIKSRRDPKQRAALTAAFRLHYTLGVEEIAVDYDSALELAVATGLTAYDASYLWLKQQLGAELVTLDRHLAHADAMSSR
jgi:predicted nucleic acid-binding protein